MNIEIYEPWIPPSLSAPMRLTFDSMHVENGEMTIGMHEVGAGRRNVALAFSVLPLAIRVINESHRLRSLARLPKQRDGSLYLVRNSEMLDSFNNDALGIYAEDPLLHLAVVTEEWIDLILAELPQVRF